MERITALCKEKGVNLTTAFEQSGVGKNFRSNLKTSNPSDKKLYLLAKYFNVSSEYLLGEETEVFRLLRKFFPTPLCLSLIHICVCTIGFELLDELTVEIFAKRTLREVVAVALIERCV